MSADCKAFHLLIVFKLLWANYMVRGLIVLIFFLLVLMRWIQRLYRTISSDIFRVASWKERVEMTCYLF